MKAIFTSLMATAAAASMASAFTIDFNGPTMPDGSPWASPLTVTSGSPLTVNVPGYGSVTFEVGSGVTLERGNAHSNDGGTTFQNSLQLDPGEAVVVTFVGPAAMNVNFDIIGINAGDAPSAVPSVGTPNEFQVSTTGGDGVGIAGISWDAVPEPSSSLLVLVGAGSLILRRRRD